MPPKDLLAIVPDASAENVFAAAQALSDRWRAHAAILQLTEFPTLAGGEAAFTAELWADVVAKMRQTAAAEHEKILRRLDLFERTGEARSAEIPAGAAERVAAFHALHADLTIVARPVREIDIAALEGALFKSGRPILVIPPDWRGGPIGKRILVAWTPKREAARALADAQIFLSEAEHVSVVTVDAAPVIDDAALPGVAIATHLARHELDVELRQIDGAGRPAEVAILAEARAMDADLIVMGGYGHSRLREFILGGATRGMLETSPIPVLMSH
ncbi:MAG: universal stress protein [Hyphomonadaceae bacterium]|nr:universal stress protein [Hyphomonadaceae bacterium]